MQHDIFCECISTLSASEGSGFSFVNEFTAVLWKHKRNIGISNIMTYWEIGDDEMGLQKFYYFADNLRFNVDGINLSLLSRQNSCMNSLNGMEERFKSADYLSNIEIITIPINSLESKSIVHGVVVVLSQSCDADISNKELDIFFALLRNIKPIIFNSPNVINSYVLLHTNELTLPQNSYKIIGEALDTIAKKDVQKPPMSGLRHFSLWQLAGSDGESPFLTKVFNRNTFDSSAHNKTHKELRGNHNHYIINELKSGFFKGIKISPCVRIFSYSEIIKSLADIDYFEKLGLNDDNCTVVMVLNQDSETKFFSYIYCYYIKDIVNTPLISKEFVLDYTNNIQQLFRKGEKKCQIEILTRLMVTLYTNNNEQNFYIRASEFLRSYNEAEQCLIYMSDDNGRWKNMTDIEQFKGDTYYEHIVLPSPFDRDIPFCKFIENLILKSDSPKNITDEFSMYTNDGSTVYSAMSIATYINSVTAKSLIVLINKKHKVSNECVFYNNVFTSENFHQTRLCGLYLNQYKQLQDSIDNKNKLLSKLRHEIPNCTHAIEKSIKQIQEGKDTLKRNNILNILNTVELNNNTISLLATFFSASSFGDERFAKDKKEIDLNSFFNSYINVFRTEGLDKGVDIQFIMTNPNIIIRVSDYYMMAIVNIINNAIRYASVGTCVNIFVYPDRIEVSDIGIQIRSDEASKIFNEGFRGVEAKRTSSKGIGYGLYLTKRILKAHMSKIEVESLLEAKENVYAETAFCNYVESLDPVQRKELIYEGANDSEYNYIRQEYERIRGENGFVNSAYLNKKQDVIDFWLNRLRRYNTAFIDIIDLFFKNPIYKVTFTITF